MALKKEYNTLLAVSKTVGAFYEGVYAPVLQALPWLDSDSGLKTASETVLPKMAFLAYQISSYKDKEGDSEAIQNVKKRRQELEAGYQKMQADIRPLLRKAGIKNDDWAQLTKMVPQWTSLAHRNQLSTEFHSAVQQNFRSEPQSVVHQFARVGGVSSSIGSPQAEISGEQVLAKLMADKTKDLVSKGVSNTDIAHTFGAEGHWFTAHFISALREN